VRVPETDFDSFELIPDEALSLTPEEEAAAYEYPDGLVADDAASASPFGRTVYMDWDAGVMTGVWVSGVDSVVQVMQTALNTVRGTSPILPPWFGRSGPDPVLGQVDDAERRILHQTDIRDTLLSCHDRVTDVTKFEWLVDNDDGTVDFIAEVEIDGEVTTLVGGTILLG
jgi:hypothetical protein